MVGEEASVAEVKSLLAKNYELFQGQIALVGKGKMLEEQDKIKEVGIQPNGFLVAIMKTKQKESEADNDQEMAAEDEKADGSKQIHLFEQPANSSSEPASEEVAESNQEEEKERDSSRHADSGIQVQVPPSE